MDDPVDSTLLPGYRIQIAFLRKKKEKKSHFRFHFRFSSTI